MNKLSLMIQAKTSTISPIRIFNLINLIRGEVIIPGSKKYEQEIRCINSSKNIYPTIIIKCRDSLDVTHAFNFGRRNNLNITMKTGENDYMFSSGEWDGLLIDLSYIHSVKVDHRNGTLP